MYLGDDNNRTFPRTFQSTQDLDLGSGKDQKHGMCKFQSQEWNIKEIYVLETAIVQSIQHELRHMLANHIK